MPVTVALKTKRESVAFDIKDDRVATDPVLGGAASAPSDEMDELFQLIERSASIGDVEISEILMCAKCVGECKIF